jgi:hypothetical protein
MAYPVTLSLFGLIAGSHIRVTCVKFQLVVRGAGGALVRR